MSMPDHNPCADLPAPDVIHGDKCLCVHCQPGPVSKCVHCNAMIQYFQGQGMWLHLHSGHFWCHIQNAEPDPSWPTA